MGLRDKVALMLVSILITQVTFILSMPRSSRKEALKHYLGSFNQYKNSPLPGRELKTNNKSIGPSNLKKNNNAKISSNITPTKSIHKTYNFPETEYPLDTSPRDPFYWGMKTNSFGGLNKQGISPQPQIIKDLKKEKRLNRKLNRVSDTDYQIKREMPSPTMRFNDHETFPQVEYPMTAMETWEPHYWNTMFNQNGQQNLDFQTFDPKAIEKSTIFYKPKQQLKSKAIQYVEEMDRLKGKMQKASAASTLKPAAQDAITKLTSNAGSINLAKSDSNTTTVLPVINETDIENQCLLNVNITESSEPDDPRLLSDTITNTPEISDREVTSEIESDIILMTPIPILYINLDVCPVIESNNTENATITIVKSTVEPANEEISKYLDEFNIPKVETPSFQHETNSETIDEIKTKCDNCQFQTIELSQEAPFDEITSEDMDVLLANITDYLNVCLESGNTTHVPADEGFDLESPLNTKIPIPDAYVPEHISSLQTFLDETANTIKQSHVDKVPYTSVIVVPVGDSVKEIQLPTIESNTGAPIIIFVPATHGSEKPITSVDSPKSNSSDTVVPSDLSYNNMPNNFISEKPTHNDEPSNIQVVECITIPPSTTTIEPENTNNQSILFECENLPINSMCYAIEDTSITSTSKTNQDVSAIDEPFLEMLQPIVAITDTASHNFPNTSETFSFISDTSEGSNNLKENFSLSEIPFTVVLPLSITEDYSSMPGTSKVLSSPVHEVPTGTWVNKPDNSTSLDTSNISMDIDPAILSINFFEVKKENRDLQEYDINENEFTMPIDLVLPMDLVIDMIKNGTLLPLHNYIETPVINIETGPMGPVVELFSNNVPINKLEGDTFEMPNDTPQAIELQSIKSFTSPTHSFLPIKELGANAQSSESAQNRLPVLLDKFVTNDYNSDLSNFNKDIVWIPMEKEPLKPVNTTFNYFSSIEKSVPLPEEDTKCNELSTSKANEPSNDVTINLNRNNTLFMNTNKFIDAAMINIENSLHRPTNIISSSNVPFNIEEHYLEQTHDDTVADLIKYVHEAPQAIKFQEVQSFTNPADKPLQIKVLGPSTQITENIYNTVSLPLDEVIQSNTNDEVIENDNMIFMLDEAVTESPSIDIIEDYIPFQMNNNIQDTPLTNTDEPNKDNYSPNTFNSDMDMSLLIANKEQENDNNERNEDPLKSFNVDTVQNFKNLHTSPFAKTENIEDSGLNKAKKDTTTSYLSEEELLPATKDVKDLL